MIEDLEPDYDLELQTIVKKIKKSKAKHVCIQLPDGLKQKAPDIASYLEKHTKATVFIWLGSCFGNCDVPNLNVDLLVQFGHSNPKNNPSVK